MQQAWCSFLLQLDEPIQISMRNQTSDALQCIQNENYVKNDKLKVPRYIKIQRNVQECLEQELIFNICSKYISYKCFQKLYMHLVFQLN